MKALAAGVVIVLAIVIGAYIYLNQPQELKDPWAGRNETRMEDFTDNLLAAEQVYFVMDLRVADETTRTNIMQCVTDLAFSSAISEKNNVIYSLDNECFRISEVEGETPATLSLSQCLSEIDAARGDFTKSIFYVRESNETRMVFENELVIGMAENYTYMGCSISTGSHTAPAANINQTVVEAWQELTNRTGAGSNSTNGTSN